MTESRLPFNLNLDRSMISMDSEQVDKFKKRLMRTKTIISQSSVDEEGAQQGELEKVLTTFDLISLGVGSCVGTGMYVVAGLVAKNVAGPGVVLSFIIAAMASILSGVCYAEFGVRVPKTSGSAYMYSYVTVGEFVAFLIGWNLILEYVIGSAAGASALSACFDALGNHSMSTYLEENVGTIIGKTYPDFLGCGICLLMTLVMSLGVRRSVRFNNILNCINFLIWIFIVIASVVFADGKNWTEYGFAPYGASGIFSGAATCFYAFIGFDIIATTGAEARNPSRSIPLAIICSLVICLIAYITMSMALTLVIPFNEIHGDSALMDMFVQRGFSEAKYIVAVGAVAALTVSLFGSMFPMPRVIYAMSRDGLLFGFLSQLNERTGTPLIASIITGAMASLMSLLVGLQVLVEMMSIGTLLAYTLVSTSVLILRYQPTKFDLPVPAAHQLDVIDESPEAMVDQDDVFSDATAEKRKYKDDRGLLDDQDPSSAPKWYGALPFSNSLIESKIAMVKRYVKIYWLRLGFPSDDCVPNEKTAQNCIIFVGLLLLSEIVLCLLLVFGGSNIENGDAWAIILLVLFILAVVSCEVVILRQPQNKKKLKFMAPAVPILPSIATLFNFYLMLKLPGLTWARLGVWICIGLLLYFSFSMWNSKKEKQANASTSEPPQTEITAQTDITSTDGYNQSNTTIPVANGNAPNSLPLANGAKPMTNGRVGAPVTQHQTNGSVGNGRVTSPPGAPPSRPPLPKQESIEKYRQRSVDSVRNDPQRGPASTANNNQQRGYITQQKPPNTTANSRTARTSMADEGDPYANDDKVRRRANGDGVRRSSRDSDREDRTDGTRRQGAITRQTSAGPGPKVTYDSSMARPRPRPNREAVMQNNTTADAGVQPSSPTIQPQISHQQRQQHVNVQQKQQHNRQADPFTNLEDQW